GTFRKSGPGCATSSIGKPTMNPSPPDPPSLTLDDFVAAFEEALAQDPLTLPSPPRGEGSNFSPSPLGGEGRVRGGQADIDDFLPGPEPPLRDKVLSELIRVEQEHGWETGRPRPLAEYRRRFPEFFRDPERVQEIAFEEYRLRRQAGQDPSPQAYE